MRIPLACVLIVGGAIGFAMPVFKAEERLTTSQADETDTVTLGAVREGSFAGTVVQDPYSWGYEGMHLMADYLEGDHSMVPADGLIIVPTKVIDKGNVDAFEAELKARIAGN